MRITQFTDPHDILITDLDELQTMDKFMTKKIREMEEGKGKKSKESMVDTVFKSALKDFKANLISTYSVGNYQDGSHFRLTYKDLIDHFEQVRSAKTLNYLTVLTNCLFSRFYTMSARRRRHTHHFL